MLKKVISAPGFHPVVICADDYGLSPGVSRAIEELIAAGRLSATSVMTTLPDWRTQGPELKALTRSHPADVGLHLTLTEQPPLTACAGLAEGGRLPGVGAVLSRALSRRLPGPALRDEIRAQLDAFEDVWGAAPDYVDGHQHVHSFPQVGGILLDELTRRYRHLAQRPYIRSVWESLPRLCRYDAATGKGLILSALALPFDRAARRAGFAGNDSFRGLYDFFMAGDYRPLFRRLLTTPSPRTLIHCHPGRCDDLLHSRDGLIWPRERELAYLSSDACAEDLEEARVRPARFAELTEQT